MTRDEYLKHIGMNVPEKGTWKGDIEATQEFMELADAILNMFIALTNESKETNQKGE